MTIMIKRAEEEDNDNDDDNNESYGRFARFVSTGTATPVSFSQLSHSFSSRMLGSFS